MIQKFFATTGEGIDFMRRFDLTRIRKVAAKKEGGFTTVTFYFPDETVEVAGAFNIGYCGEGPTGFFKILLDAGLKKETAEIVMIPKITEFVISLV